jgi:hypothetical protein
MTDDTARMVRAEQADAAFKQFVGPALAVIRNEYLAKLQELAATRAMEGEPLAMVQKLATAIKIADQIEIQMRALMADGDAAKAEHAGTVARMKLNPVAAQYAAY